MILTSLEIPADADDLAVWLEDHLLGLDLAALVAELSAAHSAESLAGLPSLEDALGKYLPQVMSRGLTALPHERLQTLLTHPDLLLKLQVRVFIEGDTYWESRKQESDEMGALVEGGWRRVRTYLDESSDRIRVEDVGVHSGAGAPGETPSNGASRDGGAPATVAFAPRTTAPLSHGDAPRSGWFGHVLTGLATAAAVLLACYIVKPFSDGAPTGGAVAVNSGSTPTPAPAAKPWGWEKPGAIAADVDSAEYLHGLADAAGDWFNKRPEKRADVTKRILAFRRGCSTLILSDHQPLAEADREWLVERCRAWAGKLDAHVAALEAGGDVLEVRTAADATIRKLINAINQRAETVG